MTSSNKKYGGKKEEQNGERRVRGKPVIAGYDIIMTQNTQTFFICMYVCLSVHRGGRRKKGRTSLTSTE